MTSIVKYLDLLLRKVWLDTCMPKNMVGTHGSWWDDGLDGDILSNSGIMVHNVTMEFVWD